MCFIVFYEISVLMGLSPKTFMELLFHKEKFIFHAVFIVFAFGTVIRKDMGIHFWNTLFSSHAGFLIGSSILCYFNKKKSKIKSHRATGMDLVCFQYKTFEFATYLIYGVMFLPKCAVSHKSFVIRRKLHNIDIFRHVSNL